MSEQTRYTYFHPGTINTDKVRLYKRHTITDSGSLTFKYGVSYSLTTGSVIIEPTYETETVALTSVFSETLSIPKKTAMNDFILGLKTNNIWDKLDILYVFGGGATSVESDCLKNWINPALYNATNESYGGYSQVLSANGFSNIPDTPTGFRLARINTNFNPTTAVLPKYEIRSASIGYDLDVFSNSFSGYSVSTVNYELLYIKFGGNYQFNIGSPVTPTVISPDIPPTNTNLTVLTCEVAWGSSVNEIRVWRDFTEFTTPTSATIYNYSENGSGTKILPNSNITLNGPTNVYNAGGSNGNTMKMAFIGEWLSVTEINQFALLWNAYKTAIGIN